MSLKQFIPILDVLLSDLLTLEQKVYFSVVKGGHIAFALPTKCAAIILSILF